MMAGINNNAKIDIKCPKCNIKFKKTIRELKKPGVKCPKCGVNFETSNFKKALDWVDRKLKDFQKKFGKINIKL
jgi:peptide subunit release factor 1 (eRF1)